MNRLYDRLGDKMVAKVTFTDDSNVLTHHGVRGMKWGVHNEETQRKYGETSAEGGGGGVVIDEDDRENPDGKIETGSYNETVDNMFDWMVSKAGNGVIDLLNRHLVDIQTGQIDRAEAQIIGLVNAAAGAASGTGEALINNPKAEEMGVRYAQRTNKIRLI